MTNLEIKKVVFFYITFKLFEGQKVFSYICFCCLTVIMFYAPSKQIKLIIVFHQKPKPTLKLWLDLPY